MPEDITPSVDAIDWGEDAMALANRLADRCSRPDVWPTVDAWCKNLAARAYAATVEITHEERNRKETNLSPLDRERMAVEKDRAERKRIWKKQRGWK